MPITTIKIKVTSRGKIYPVRILFVSSEAHPLIKTGGLADVSGSLPAALRNLGSDVRLLIPGYQPVLEKLRNLHPVTTLHHLPLIGSVNILMGEMPDTGLPVLAIQSPGLFQRAGGPYIDARGHDWEDNPLRFGILSRIAAILSCSESPLSDWIPDIVHCNDWQSGLTPAYLRHMHTYTAKSVFGIHNLAFQGNYPAEWTERLGLPPESFQMHGLEYYGQLSFLKAGIFYSDTLTTVSPTYAKEIQTPQFGFGLQGLLSDRSHEIHGILNGIDTDEWNPAIDPYLASNYDDGRLADKNTVKLVLQSRLGLHEDIATPLLGVVSRLTYQKGLDTFLAIAEPLLQQGCQIALLGSGESGLENGFLDLAHRYPQQTSVNIGYNEPLSHQIMAGADIFIMPSRFEPCGLNQMYGLRYGTPPIVTRTGGLADSVQDANANSLSDGTATGFVIDTADPNQLWSAVERALIYYRDPKIWHEIQRNGMKLDLGWNHSAQAYINVYNSLLA